MISLFFFLCFAYILSIRLREKKSIDIEKDVMYNIEIVKVDLNRRKLL